MPAFNIGTLTTTGWTAWTSQNPQTSTTGLWATATSSVSVSAYSQAGFTSSYNGTPTSVSKKYSDAVFLAPVNVIDTGYTDTIQGGYLTSGLYPAGIAVGISVGPQILLDLGPVSGGTTTGRNQLIGYGNSAGIRIGVQTASPYTYSYSSGAVIGGKSADQVFGQAYGIGAAGIENYGVIVLRNGADLVNGFNNYGVNSTIIPASTYGLINWGLIDVGGASKADGADQITGVGSLIGISNDSPSSGTYLPSMFTGAGDDLISGGANVGSNCYGIVNNGFVDMGSGNDTYQSVQAYSGIANRFGGTGTVVMGQGNDIVQGFGTGTFWGGNEGVTDFANTKGKNVTNYDSLYLITDQTYTFTSITTLIKGQSVSGFTINNGIDTMTVYGFDSFGTSAADQQAIAAGTYTL